MKTLLIFLFTLASFVPAKASELVLNGGFETGDFSNWDILLQPELFSLEVESVTVNSGHFGADFHGDDSNVIAQTFATVPGATYTFSFFLEGRFDIVPDELEAAFFASWNNTTALDSEPSTFTGFGFTKFSFTEVGTGMDTIEFDGHNAPGSYVLDDVSVQGPLPDPPSTVPEPAAFGLAGTGLAAGIFMRNRFKDRA